MRKILIILLVMLVGCSSQVKKPGKGMSEGGGQPFRPIPIQNA